MCVDDTSCVPPRSAEPERCPRPSGPWGTTAPGVHRGAEAGSGPELLRPRRCRCGCGSTAGARASAPCTSRCPCAAPGPPPPTSSAASSTWRWEPLASRASCRARPRGDPGTCSEARVPCAMATLQILSPLSFIISLCCGLSNAPPAADHGFSTAHSLLMMLFPLNRCRCLYSHTWTECKHLLILWIILNLKSIAVLKNRLFQCH